MRADNLNDHVRILNRRFAAVSVLLVASIITNAALSVAVATMNKVVLVPSLTDAVEVSAQGGVGRDYLERLARDAVYLFLNRTPESARYFEQNIERISEPQTYQQIKAALILDRQKRQDSRTSQAFFPTEFVVKPDRLSVRVIGDLQTISGTQVSETSRQTFDLTFKRHGSLVLLSSIERLGRDGADTAPSKPIVGEIEP